MSLDVLTRAALDRVGARRMLRRRPVPIRPTSGPCGSGEHDAIAIEERAAAWMRRLGAVESEVVPEDQASGVDVRSVDFVARVQAGAPTGGLVRGIAQAAAAEGRGALLVTTAPAGAAARAAARDLRVALLVLHGDDLAGDGALGVRYRAEGLPVTARR